MILNPLAADCLSYTTTLADDATPPAAWPSHTTITMTQPHGSSVEIVTNATSDARLSCDGVLTAQPLAHLQVKTADCLPILLYHPSGVVGAIHAGRKGTELGILQAALQRLKKDWAITTDLKIWFGPAICSDCYQIDRASDMHYDLIAANQQQLYSVFPQSAVELRVSGRCTAHEPDSFNSYRREGAGVAMNYSGIMLI